VACQEVAAGTRRDPHARAKHEETKRCKLCVRTQSVRLALLRSAVAETASVMVVYLDEAWQEGRKAGTLLTMDDLIAGAVESGSKRVRPLLMTVMTNIFGLLPVLLDTGVGADVAKRIAAPMWGGLVSLTLLTLLVIPAMYVVWRGYQLWRLVRPKMG
jgi:copper/silver efflux system protein